MYVWTAIDVDCQLEKIKNQIQLIETRLETKNPALTLPFHVSLKISFGVDDAVYPEIEQTILNYYKSVRPFEIEVDDIEIENTILWIRMKENPSLRQIHEDLDHILSEKYGISRHTYDLDFKFHATLFLDPDKEKVLAVYEQIKGTVLPSSLHARNMILGTSESGAPGTYHVTHRIEIS